MFDDVLTDIRRLTDQERSMIGKIGVMLLHPGLHAVLLFRFSRWLHRHHMQTLALCISYINSVLTGAQISRHATIGRGFVIYHPQGTVIGATAVIGSNCTLVSGNVIGQLYGGDDRPTIGDDFYAGAGAKIFGKIQIGNHVRVGPNAVVTMSLPDGVTVAAAPSKIIFQAASRPRMTPSGVLAREAIRQRLIPLLASTVDGGRVSDAMDESTRLLGEGIGLDSLEVLNLLGAVEEEFDLTVDEGELTASDFETVGSLVTCIQERLSR